MLSAAGPESNRSEVQASMHRAAATIRPWSRSPPAQRPAVQPRSTPYCRPWSPAAPRPSTPIRREARRPRRQDLRPVQSTEREPQLEWISLTARRPNRADGLSWRTSAKATSSELADRAEVHHDRSRHLTTLCRDLRIVPCHRLRPASGTAVSKAFCDMGRILASIGGNFSVFKPERREHNIGVPTGDAVNVGRINQARLLSIRDQFVRSKAFEIG
jgi:hypothetical protein